jgi:hypothetical protein
MLIRLVRISGVLMIWFCIKVIDIEWQRVSAEGQHFMPEFLLERG